MVTMGRRAEIAAAGGFVGVEMGDGARFGEHVVGKDARQLVLADHHLHVDAEVVGRAENFDDAADGRARGRGPTGDLDIDDQAFEASCACGFGGALPRCRARDAAWRRRRPEESPGREESGWAASCARRRERQCCCGSRSERGDSERSPTTVGLRRSSTRTMRPWQRPSALGGSTSTSTWSPCMAPLISLGGMKMSSVACWASAAGRRLGRTKP